MQQALQRSSLVPSGFVVESAYLEGDKAVIAVRASGNVGLCPSCGTVSRRVHSRYRRRVTDLPLSGRIVQLLLIARRFRCDAVLCGRQIFTERFAEGVLAPSARRTARLDSIVHHLGLALGGRPAAGFAKRLMLPVSKDTLLRVVRRRSRPPADPLRVIGIDGLGGAITDTPASSATWNGAGWSLCSLIGSPQLPKRGSLLIPRSRSLPVTVVGDMAKRQQRPCRMRYRSQIVDI